MKYAVMMFAIVSMLPAAEHVDAQIAGKWTATFDAGVSERDGKVVVTDRRNAVLTLTATGDSVHGTWTIDKAPPGAPPAEVRGTFKGNALVLTTGMREMNVTVDGKPEKRRVRTDWVGRVNGNTITGTMQIWMGPETPPIRNWNARR